MLIASLVLLTAPAQDPGAAPARAERDPSEIVCVSRPVTGSRTSFEQRCRTRAEWAALRRDRNASREPDQPNHYYPH